MERVLEDNRAQNEPMLPQGWTWATLGEACDVILGQSPPSSTYNTEGIGLPFYQGKAEFGDLYPQPRRWCSAPVRIAEAGDVLISVRAPVGPTNLCRERSCIGRGLAALRPKDEMPSRYFLYFLRSIAGDWESKATGTTFSAISRKVLQSQMIPLPPLVEQRRIVTEIDRQLSAATALEAVVEANLVRAERLQKAIFKKAFTGRLISDEPTLACARALTPIRRWHNQEISITAKD